METIFLSALGPILPFLSVIGKQLGISEIVMGSVFTIIPIFYFIAKMCYGYIVDYFVQQRTIIFTLAVASMGISYLLIYFVPHTPLQKKHFTDNVTCSSLIFCDLHVSKALRTVYRIWKEHVTINPFIFHSDTILLIGR